MMSQRVVTGLPMLFVLATLAACGGGGGGGGAAPVPVPVPTPTPHTGVIALPKTGQTTCYDVAGAVIACAGTGQDGALQTGVAGPSPRFTVDGTGNCVTDNLTGLMWTRNANLPVGTRTWQQALDFANNLNLCGFTDWRLPNRKELRTLANYGATDNATALVALGFNNVQASNYWSSTSLARSPTLVWVVNMFDDRVSLDDKTTAHCVWPVRAGQ